MLRHTQIETGTHTHTQRHTDTQTRQTHRDTHRDTLFYARTHSRSPSGREERKGGGSGKRLGKQGEVRERGAGSKGPERKKSRTGDPQPDSATPCSVTFLEDSLLAGTGQSFAYLMPMNPPDNP